MGKRKLSVTGILGVGLILCGVCLFLFSQLQARTAEKTAAETAARLEALLPERTAGIPGLRRETAMPVLQIDGTDYCALVEIPAFGRTLPVGSAWDPGTLRSLPCRFWGSAYDDSLVIGGADQQGQFDFCDQIDIGHVVILTDMTGAEFTYTVARVERASHGETDWLLSGEYDLTLFAGAAYSPEYIAVRCARMG